MGTSPHILNEKNSQRAKYSLQIVVPIRYSIVRPLLLTLRADLAICGIQKNEYILPMNNSVIEGDTITRTMKDRNINMVSPKFGVEVS
jgi:hypothetical protein